MKTKRVISHDGANWMLFAAGMAIVWFSTHSVVAMLGALVAALHIQWEVKEWDGSE